MERGAVRSGNRFWRSPVLVAAVVLVMYAAWVGWSRHLGQQWGRWADPGSTFLQRAHSSPAIDADRRFATSSIGYDGQFFLYIAQDPREAAPYLDDPAYRYGRIFYPILARALALGRQDAIPFMLVVINVMAVALGAWAVAKWLHRRGVSAWFALLFAVFPGVFIAVQLDLSEALAYSLTALALVVFDERRLGRLLVSAAVFALAGLTREGALLFALVWAGTLVVGRRRREAALFASVAFLPYLVFRLVFLRLWLGAVGVPSGRAPSLVPFAGITAFYPWRAYDLQTVYTVVLPGLFCLALAAVALYRGARLPEVWALLLNAIVFVVFLPKDSMVNFTAAGRISTGVVLALLLSIPALDRVLPASRSWLWIPIVAWFSPWYNLVPDAFPVFP
jgi:hypothetical protein